MPVFPALLTRLLSRFRPCLSLTCLPRLIPDPACTRTILPRLLPDPVCTCDSRLAFSWNSRLSPTSPLPTICLFVSYQLLPSIKLVTDYPWFPRVLHFGPQLVCDSRGAAVFQATFSYSISYTKPNPIPFILNCVRVFLPSARKRNGSEPQNTDICIFLKVPCHGHFH